MSIDSYYEHVIAELQEKGDIIELSFKLASLETNSERALFVSGILDKLKLQYPKFHDIKKTEALSTNFRNHGNKCYEQRKNYEAWQYYNLALVYAPWKSEVMSVAYANRSALFFTLRDFEASLKDVEKALSMKCPNKLINKLQNRQESCKEALSKMKLKENCSTKSAIQKILSFQDPRNDQYSCCSKKLEILYTPEMGRHVVAKENIRVGEILAQEYPYFPILRQSNFLFFCNHCFSKEKNLIPCDKCCFALYCSQNCKESAYTSYHKIECSLMPTLVKLEFSKLELLSLRTVIKARYDHDSWESLFKTIDAAEATRNTQFHGCVKVNDKYVYDSKYYTPIHMLETNVDKRSMSDIFQKSVTVAVFLKALKVKTNFLEGKNTEEGKKIMECAASLLLLQAMITPTNMHALSTTIENAQGEFTEEFPIGDGAYAFLSLLNHSCAPNVVRFSEMGSAKTTLFALRPIAKGEQLYDNYGAHHALEPRGSRREGLASQYKFSCLCEACRDNWPTYFSLKPAKNLTKAEKKLVTEVLSRESLEKLQKGDIEFASFVYKDMCTLAEMLDPTRKNNEPCKQLAEVQESLKQCLGIFHGVLSKGYKTSVTWNGTQ